MGKTYSPKETGRNAEKRLGEQKYSAIKNNCEHFARECKTGEHKSNQTSGLEPVADAVDIAADVAIGVTLGRIHPVLAIAYAILKKS